MAADRANAPSTGVGQEPVLSIQEYGLECWYNEIDEHSFSGDEQIKKAALEFHRFVSAVFGGATVLPFRFPTILESLDELREHLDEKAYWYATALGHMEGMAQFEARIIQRAAAPAAEAPSGKAYLEEKKQSLDGLRLAEAAVLTGLEDFIRDSHLKEAPGGLRLYLLSEKSLTTKIRAALKGIALPPGLELRFSGPWPSTEFLPAEDQE